MAGIDAKNVRNALAGNKIYVLQRVRRSNELRGRGVPACNAPSDTPLSHSAADRVRERWTSFSPKTRGCKPLFYFAVTSSKELLAVLVSLGN